MIFGLCAIAGMVWLYDWASSGRMDRFLQAHPDPKVTPVVLDGLARLTEVYDGPAAAAHYYRWMLEKFPEHPGSVRARYYYAAAMEEQGRKDIALEQYQVLQASYSYTSYAGLARRKIEKFKY